MPRTIPGGLITPTVATQTPANRLRPPARIRFLVSEAKRLDEAGKRFALVPRKPYAHPYHWGASSSGTCGDGEAVRAVAV